MTCCDLSHIECDERRIVLTKWFSSTDTSRAGEPTHIGNTTAGMWPEIERLGQAATDVGSGTLQYSTTGDGLAYSTRLRPISDISRLYERQHVRIIWMAFNAYDTTTTGGTGQDAATLTAISDSLASTNDGYMQSRFRNSVLAGWQPNWFRPRILIDGRPVFFGPLDTTTLGSRLGDLSIGLTLPYCWRGDMRIGRINKGIAVYAQAAQRIDLGGGVERYQRYPVDAEIAFLIDDNDCGGE